MRTHVIVDGVVVNTLACTPEDAQSMHPEAICIDGSGMAGGIGWTLDEETLVEPRLKGCKWTHKKSLKSLRRG